jgi:hypothetical protein
MTPDDQIKALERQADEAERREQERQAAFLYEQARRLAADNGSEARAFSAGVKAAKTWSYAGDYRRGLTILLGLLYEIPETADSRDVYDAKDLHYSYLVELMEAPGVDDILACGAELQGMCVSLGEPDSRDILDRSGRLLRMQGRWAEALTQFEIAWSRQDAGGVYLGAFAAWAAVMALRLGQRRDAQRWLRHIASDDWPDNARVRAANVRLLIALFDNDPSAARHALLNFDDAMLAVERARYSANATEPMAAAMMLDQRFGDPLADTHPIARRLADFPQSEIEQPLGAYSWHRANLFRQLAGMRYAAGIKPVDDYYYRKPHNLRRRAATRLAGDMPQRASAARNTCDEAMAMAARLDKKFGCSWRQQETQSVRGRIDEIAVLYGL